MEFKPYITDYASRWRWRNIDLNYFFLFVPLGMVKKHRFINANALEVFCNLKLRFFLCPGAPVKLVIISGLVLFSSGGVFHCFTVFAICVRSYAKIIVYRLRCRCYEWNGFLSEGYRKQVYQKSLHWVSLPSFGQLFNFHVSHLIGHLVNLHNHHPNYHL